ncbi:MAG: hypothetical protein C5B49_03150 [Bdellovibrio sp.]|nr:MAG: hypothetical protein C5B49_03150 [Bdellovibrio sp.]
MPLSNTDGICAASTNVHGIIAENTPVVDRSPGRVEVSWQRIHDRVARAGYDKDKLRVSVYVNGIEHPEAKELPFTTVKAVFGEEAPHKQYDYYVIHKLKQSDGTIKIIDISGFNLKEITDPATVEASTFNGTFPGETFKVHVGKGLQAQGLEDWFTNEGLKRSYKKIVAVPYPKANPEIFQFMNTARQGVKTEAHRLPNGKFTTVTLRKVGSSEKLTVDAKNFSIKPDAAFNGNSFFWDDMIAASEGKAIHDPELAGQAIDFQLALLDFNDGVIPREVRKENLLSLWFTDHVRAGENARPNLNYTNPFLLNLAARNLYANDKTPENFERLKHVSLGMERYIYWMEKNRSIKNAEGQIVGFNGSAYGTGMDNSRGDIGNANEAAALHHGFVDFISYHTTMLNDMDDFNRLFAEKSNLPEERDRYLRVADAARAKADQFKKVINDYYWDPDQCFYYDVNVEKNGRVTRDREYTGVWGFLPLLAEAASEQQVNQIISKKLTPETFGGRFPLPSNMRGSVPDSYLKHRPYETFGETTAEDGFSWRDHGYWDTPATTWPSASALVIEGFHRSGRPDIAARLNTDLLAAQTSTKSWEESYGRAYKIHPNGSVEEKAMPLRHKPHQPRVNEQGVGEFLGWAVAQLGNGLSFHSMGFQPTLRGLNWILPQTLGVGDTMGFSNRPYGGGMLKKIFLHRPNPRKYLLEVESDRPFTIVMDSLPGVDGPRHRVVKVNTGYQQIEMDLGEGSRRFRKLLSGRAGENPVNVGDDIIKALRALPENL